jgi:hypothetical protein
LGLIRRRDRFGNSSNNWISPSNYYIFTYPAPGKTGHGSSAQYRLCGCSFTFLMDKMASIIEVLKELTRRAEIIISS